MGGIRIRWGSKYVIPLLSNQKGSFFFFHFNRATVPASICATLKSQSLCISDSGKSSEKCLATRITQFQFRLWHFVDGKRVSNRSLRFSNLFCALAFHFDSRACKIVHMEYLFTWFCFIPINLFHFFSIFSL